MKSTLSFRMSEQHNEGHNLRTIYVPYVDVSKSKDNIYYINHTKEQAYEYLFADAVRAYNEKQRRKPILSLNNGICYTTKSYRFY